MPDELQIAGPTEDPLRLVDWEEVRARMCRVIGSVARGRLDRDQIEDCAQEGCIGLMRAVAKGPVRNLEALSVSIATRGALRMLRRRGISAGARSPGAVDIDEVLDRLIDPSREPVEDVLVPEDLQFYVRELLGMIDLKCRRVFELWMDTLNHRLVAERAGLTHANARAIWSRCRKAAQAALQADDGALGAWFRDQRGTAAQ